MLMDKTMNKSEYEVICKRTSHPNAMILSPVTGTFPTPLIDYSRHSMTFTWEHWHQSPCAQCSFAFVYILSFKLKELCQKKRIY